MGITKRPTAPASASPAALDKFIQGAPDAKAPAETEKASEDTEEGSVQITLRISKAQLERITSIAKRQGIPRASYIKRAIALQVEADEKN